MSLGEGTAKSLTTAVRASVIQPIRKLQLGLDAKSQGQEKLSRVAYTLSICSMVIVFT